MPSAPRARARARSPLPASRLHSRETARGRPRQGVRTMRSVSSSPSPSYSRHGRGRRRGPRARAPDQADVKGHRERPLLGQASPPARPARRRLPRARARAPRRAPRRLRGRSKRPSASAVPIAGRRGLGPRSFRFGLANACSGERFEGNRLHTQLRGDLIGVAQASSAPSTTSALRGWRSLMPATSRARWASPTIARTSSTSSSSAMSGSPASGQPARKMLSGAPAQASVTRFSPKMLGEERHHRGDSADALDQGVPRASSAPRHRPRSGGASGGYTSWRRRRRTPRSSRSACT